MKPIWAEEFPRLYEVYCESEQANAANYFEDFGRVLGSPLAQSAYKKLEVELEQLEDIAWQELKQKAINYVVAKDERRAWSQLFDILNEAKGYLYLKSEGCKKIHFIPECKGSKTPDIRAQCGCSIALLDVKTINVSDEEINYLRYNTEHRDNPRLRVFGPESISIPMQRIRRRIKRRIKDAVEQGRKQLFEYAKRWCPADSPKRMTIYLIIHPDAKHIWTQQDIDNLSTYVSELQVREQIEIRYSVV